MNNDDWRLLGAGAAVGAAWVATRVAMAYIWFTLCQYVMQDVEYYFRSMASPDASALVEYPTPILWLMRLFDFLARGHYATFLDLVVGLMVALDAIVTITLFWRARPLAAAYWVVFSALLGPIMWFRIDMIPAAAVTGGLLVLSSRPKTGGALLAIGAATKFFPALLILPALGRHAKGQARLVGFALTGLGLGVVSLLWNGWARSVSPLTWQSVRGLQIESLAATWSMILHAARPGSVVVYMSQFHAYQVDGAGVAGGELVASVLMGAFVLFVTALTVLLAVVPAIYDPTVSRPGHGYALLLAATAILVALIAADKTFSPQYLIWLGGPLGLVLARAVTPGERRAAVCAAGLGGVIALLTQLEFPLNYFRLLANPGDVGVTAVLVARNALMAVLTLLMAIWAVRAAWRVAIGR